ncbi:MAG: hypothetical protein GF313_11945 [Caldithrix sp.]|nr:hypothetical protein [Caldithrix sp.]
MKQRMIIVLWLLSVIQFLACEKNPTSPSTELKPARTGLYIINEGQFTQSNSSISFFDVDEGKMTHNIFQTGNDQSLGSVANSMTVQDTLGFIVVNNSHKVEVISLNTWKRTATITLPAGSSPRHMAIINASKAYITNLFANTVSIIDLTDYSVSGEIAVGANPEGIVISQQKAFVANSGLGSGTTVSVIDIQSDQVMETVTVGDNPISVGKKDNGGVLVLCTGSYGDFNNPNDSGTDGSLYTINVEDNTIEDSLALSGHPSRLTLGDDGKGYFINNGMSIVEFEINTLSITNNDLRTDAFYGLKVHTGRNRLYGLDAKDFQQQGALEIYDLQGNLIESHTTGITPGSICIVR